MSDHALTPPKLAKRYGVSSSKVTAWIRTGELAAVNIVAKVGGRPRFIILPEALAAFEARRAVPVAPTPTRRRRRQVAVQEFF